MSEVQAAKEEAPAIEEVFKKTWGPFEKVNGVNISRALLHQGAEIPGRGIQTSLQQTKTPGIVMKMTPIGLCCKIIKNSLKERAIEFFVIPEANVIVAFCEAK